MSVVRRPIPTSPPQSPEAFAQEMREGCAGLLPSLPSPQAPRPQPRPPAASVSVAACGIAAWAARQGAATVQRGQPFAGVPIVGDNGRTVFFSCH